MVTLIALGIAVAGVSAALGLWARTKRAEAEIQKMEAKARTLLAGPARYQIKIADWGPDFTGVGTLPRWRWVVVDANHVLRVAFEPGYDMEQKVYMLGNSPTAPEALVAAAQWIEQQEHPVVILDAADL